LKDVMGKLSGLGLFREEIKLFPKEFVSPEIGFGFGEKDPSKPKYIVGYQLNVQVCPYISEDHLCKIYEKRPLTCQAFPLRPLGPIGTTIASPKSCLFVEKTESKIGSLESMLPLSPKKFRAPLEWMALSFLNLEVETSFKQYPDDAQILWKFDLKTKEWQIM